MLLLVGIAPLALACGAVPKTSVKQSPGFSSVAHSVETALANDDLNAFARLVSESGIHVVQRSKNWQSSILSNHNHFQTFIGKYQSNLYSDNVKISEWDEQDAHYDLDMLRSDSFIKSFDEFHRLFKLTYGFRTDPAGSDPWNERYLGPSVIGKVASNSYWIAFLKPEANNWKVWRLEYVVH